MMVSLIDINTGKVLWFEYQETPVKQAIIWLQGANATGAPFQLQDRNAGVFLKKWKEWEKVSRELTDFPATIHVQSNLQ